MTDTLEFETATEERPSAEKIDFHGYRELGSPESLAALYEACAEAQGAFEEIERTRSVKITSDRGAGYSFEYAEMDEINRACKAALKANRLACFTPFSRPTLEDNPMFHLVVSHAAGARLHITFAFVAQGDVKQLGGQTTYIMRYLFSKFWRLHAEGDADDQPMRPGETGAEVQKLEKRDRTQPPKPAARKGAEPKAETKPANPDMFPCTRCHEPTSPNDLKRSPGGHPFHVKCYELTAAEKAAKDGQQGLPIGTPEQQALAREAVDGPRSDTDDEPVHEEPHVEIESTPFDEPAGEVVGDDVLLSNETHPELGSQLLVLVKSMRWNTVRLSALYKKLYPTGVFASMTVGQARGLYAALKTEQEQRANG